MVFLVSTNWFPANKAEEVGKKYLEARSKYPDDLSISKPILRVAVKTTKDGIKSISISEIQPGKVAEALAITNEHALMYANIEGYKYKIETWMSGIEAMPLIGLKMPT